MHLSWAPGGRTIVLRTRGWIYLAATGRNWSFAGSCCSDRLDFAHMHRCYRSRPHDLGDLRRRIVRKNVPVLHAGSHLLVEDRRSLLVSGDRSFDFDRMKGTERTEVADCSLVVDTGIVDSESLGQGIGSMTAGCSRRGQTS